MTRHSLKVIVVGGASGVGKSTVLSAADLGLGAINTGTLFKARMSIANRDQVRTADWSKFEEEVTLDLTRTTLGQLVENGKAVIDTHFAAKILGHDYRLGLKQSLLFDLARQFAQHAESADSSLELKVVLFDCDPHSLLERRRLDSSRKRELIPSDCYNALRENAVCSRRYVSEFRRALHDSAFTSIHRVSYIKIKNEAIGQAAEEFLQIWED